jgi:hypothetical protein
MVEDKERKIEEGSMMNDEPPERLRATHYV